MTPNEYQILLNPQLSHAARSLYTLYLHRKAQTHYPVCVLYPECAHVIATVHAPAHAADVTVCFEELIQLDLVHCIQGHDQTHYHTQAFTLPQSDFKQAAQARLPLPADVFAMRIDWRPDAQFTQLSRLCGLMQDDFSEEELGEFIAYWLGRPDVLQSQHHWMLKFIKVLKNKRLAKPAQHLATVGYQTFSQVRTSSSQNTLSERAREMMEQAKAYIAEQAHDKK